MKIDAIDAFYLAMPKVTEEADGRMTVAAEAAQGDNRIIRRGEAELVTP